MHRALSTSLLCLTTLILAASLPIRADAQVLTVEVEGAVEASVERSAPAPGRGAVVLVRPEDDARIAPPPPPSQVVSVAPAPARADEPDDEDVEGWGHLAIFADRMELGDLDLSIGTSAEIEAVRGLSLGPDWAGRDALNEAVTGGLSFGFGMRAAHYLRGPDLRFSLGGGDLGGEFAPVQGAPDGVELAIGSIFFIRVELALGLQIPIGPVTPYVVGIGSVGLGLVDVDVRDARLGQLGTETIETGLFSAGFEAGIDVEVDDGLELGFAFRANVVGTPSLGGVFRLGFGGE